MKVLLTGATGNLGREVLALADVDIVAFGREDWKNIDVKMDCDIDVVIHAASDLRSNVTDSPLSLLDSNVIATARMLEAIRQHRIPRFILISSGAVYGEDMRTIEDMGCSPVTINGITKYLNEKVTAEFCKKHKIKCEILRIFNMYGGKDHFSIFSHIKRAIETGEPFFLNNHGIAQRDFIHVMDVAKCILQLLKMDVPYTYLNIGTGVATRISSLIDLIKLRFPELVIRHSQELEAEYSRANIGRLSQLINCDFLRIEDYLRNDFMRCIK